MRFLHGLCGIFFLGLAGLFAAGERVEYRIWEDISGTMPIIRVIPLGEYTAGELFAYFAIVTIFAGVGLVFIWCAFRRRSGREPLAGKATNGGDQGNGNR